MFQLNITFASVLKKKELEQIKKYNGQKKNHYMQLIREIVKFSKVQIIDVELKRLLQTINNNQISSNQYLRKNKFVSNCKIIEASRQYLRSLIT